MSPQKKALFYICPRSRTKGQSSSMPHNDASQNPWGGVDREAAFQPGPLTYLELVQLYFISLTSARTLLSKMQICSDVTVMLENNLPITQLNFGLLCVVLFARNTRWTQKMHPAESSHVGTHKTHALQTSTSYHRSPCTRRTTLIHFWRHSFPSISDGLPSTSSRSCTSCNPSHTHCHKQTPGLLKANYKVYCCIHILLTHLTNVQLSTVFIRFLSFLLLTCHWQSL